MGLDRYTLEELKQKFRYNPENGRVYALNCGRWRNQTKEVNTKTPLGYYIFMWKLNEKVVPILAHRLAYELHTNSLLGNYIVDHDDQNKLNNKFSNLKKTDKNTNNKNLTMRKTNKSGVSGVEYRKYKSGREAWIATISVDKSRKYLGCFSDKKDAIKARKLAIVKYGFNKNHS